MGVLDRADLDERDEAFQQALDFIQQSSKRWHKRLTFKNLRFAERYIEGELELFVLVKGTGVGDEQFGARLHRIPAGGFEVEHRDWQVLCPIRQPAESGCSIEAERLVADADGDQQAMLIDDVELINQPELFSVPTLVRFEGKKRLLERLRGAAYLSA
jgi:hypothetical protein